MCTPPTATSARILVVDDDRVYRRFLDVCLRHLGHAVWSADDGDDALRTWEREGGEFDLVLTCARAGGMTGPELRDELTRRRPGARVLILTTGDDDGLGALPQPNSVETVIETLAAALTGPGDTDGVALGGASGGP